MKFIKFLFIIFITLTSTIKADSNENLINELKEGGKLVFIRHAYAPGGGDPENFNINNCTTQRNLNKDGREQANRIGDFFNNYKIPIHKVISSEWCRCKETALLGFKNFETKIFLNSFFSPKFSKNKSQQIKDLKKYVKEWKNEKNLLLITHYVVISEVLDYTPSSGEIIVADKSFKKLGSIKIGY
jgi:phosphohistidine phosphatase SixA